MEQAQRIAGLIEPMLEGMGYELVRVHLSGGHRPTVQVMAERRDGRAMTVEDCAEISRMVSPALDVADPIASAYTLEVSSPGIDRPLVRPKDFERFAGFEARVETDRPIGGRRRFRGRLMGLDGAEVRLRCEGAEVRLPLAEVSKAKLVLTDELLAATPDRRDA